MKYIFYVLCMTWLITLIDMGSVSAQILTPAGLTREARSTIARISDPSGNVWAKMHLEEFTNALVAIQRKRNNSLENKLLKSEIITNATNFITDLKNKSYTFDIPTVERDNIENFILSYQKEFVIKVREYIQNYATIDQKGSGDMHFTLRSNETDVTISINPYKITSSSNDKNIEIDAKITINVIQKKLNDRFEIMIDGSVKLIDHDIYISLRDYAIIPPKSQQVNISSYIETIKEMKGKVYHQKLTHELASALAKETKQKEFILKSIEPMLDILMNNSILTPIAKQGDMYVLALSSKTAKLLSRIMQENASSIFYDFPIELAASIALPLDIRTDGKQIYFSKLNAEMRLNGVVSRDPTNTILLNMSVSEVGTLTPWKLAINKTPIHWTLMGSSDDYTIDATLSKTTVSATIKKWNTILGTAKIDNTSINAWTYDLSAIWEQTTYNWSIDAQDTETENISLRLWSNMRQEFEQFTIVRPTMREEMDQLSYFLSARDTTRKSHLQYISSYLESFYLEHGNKYPKVQKNGCTESIQWNRNNYMRYSAYKDPKSLSSASCPNGYYYRTLIDADNYPVYILASRVEDKSNANYDAQKVSLTTGSYRSIMGNISSNTGILSTNPTDWYYVYPVSTLINSSTDE